MNAFLQFCPKARQLRRLALQFRAMLRWRKDRRLKTWMEKAIASGFRFLGSEREFDELPDWRRFRILGLRLRSAVLVMTAHRALKPESREAYLMRAAPAVWADRGAASRKSFILGRLRAVSGLRAPVSGEPDLGLVALLAILRRCPNTGPTRPERVIRASDLGITASARHATPQSYETPSSIGSEAIRSPQPTDREVGYAFVKPSKNQRESNSCSEPFSEAVCPGTEARLGRRQAGPHHPLEQRSAGGAHQSTEGDQTSNVRTRGFRSAQGKGSTLGTNYP